MARGWQIHAPKSLPKVEIPMFERNNPKGWIRLCEKFFYVHNTDEEDRVETAALFFREIAHVWYRR